MQIETKRAFEYAFCCAFKYAFCALNFWLSIWQA